MTPNSSVVLFKILFIFSILFSLVCFSVMSSRVVLFFFGSIEVLYSMNVAFSGYPHVYIIY